MSERVYSLFKKSIEAKMQVGEAMAPLIDTASDILVNCLLNEKKILICGNGVSAALSELFASVLQDRFEKERPGLPAISLSSHIATYTSIAADQGSAEVYAKPVRALGHEDDVLVILSTSGNPSNLIRAVSAAHARGMRVLAITGRDGGDLSSLLDVNDLELCVEINSRSRIHEIHLLIIFCICDLIDHKLFGIE